MRLAIGLLLLLVIALSGTGAVWIGMSLSSPDTDAPPLPALILLFTAIAISLVMVVVSWVGLLFVVLYKALTGKELHDIRGPSFLVAFFTAFDGGGADGSGEGDGA